MAGGTGSDFIFDLQCSPCIDEGLNNEATQFCTKCNLHFCVSCIEAHDRMFKRHTTLNKEEFQQHSQQGDHQFTEICTKHSGKVIDMYCEEDDVVGCAVCIALNHRTCETIQYIPNMDIDRKNAKELDETMKQVSASCQKYLCMKDELRKKLDINNKETVVKLELVEQKRLQINEVLDKFQEILLSQVRDRNDNVEANLNRATLQCDKVLRPLKAIETNLKNSDAMDHAQSFVALKVAKQSLSEHKVIDENIQAFEIPEPIQVNDMMQAVSSSIWRTSLLLLRGPQTDVCELGCWGPSSDERLGLFCPLPNGHVICTDKLKDEVYEFDAYSNLLHSIKLSDEPSGLCMITEDEVAVTISNEMKVQFLKINDGFEIARSFTFDWECSGILNLGDKLFIIHHYAETIGIYNLDGKLLSTIDQDESGNKLITGQKYITCNSDQSKVFIWDDDQATTVFDSHGKFLRYINCQDDMSDDEDDDTVIGDVKTVTINSCQGAVKGLRFETIHYHVSLKEPESPLYSDDDIPRAFFIDSSS